MQVGGVTIKWVNEATKFTQEINMPSNIKKIKTDMLIFQASEDVLVDPEGQNELCTKLPSCTINIISGAKHEILMENDLFRNQIMKSTVDFLKIKTK